MTTRMTRSTTRSMTNRTLGTNLVVLDNGANVSIFCPEQLLNIQPLTVPTVSRAFQGSVLTCFACGDLPGFFPVDMSTVIPQNILSFSQVESKFRIICECGRFVVETRYGDIIFKKNELDLYVSDIDTWPTIPKHHP